MHEKILPDAQRRVLSIAGRFATDRRFYLAGGTAVALHLGHRESVDFDFFAADPTAEGPTLRDQLAAALPDLLTTDVSPGTFNGVAAGVKLSFCRYRYPLLDTAELWEAYAVHVASLRDLSAMKLSAIAQRGHKKDFIDLHALLASGLSLPEMLDWYRQRYAVSDVMPVRIGLAYFDDAEEQPIPTMHTEVDWTRIKADIRRAARSLP